MNDNHGKKPISAAKLAANRKNGQRSGGPKTTAGKQRSSQNNYKHGFYALRLFPSQELCDRDTPDYNRVLASYWTHYNPVGDLEKLCVEKIAVESLRLARLLGHEQKVLGWRHPFEATSINKIVRYESHVYRQLEKATQQLERLQALRKARSNQCEASDVQVDYATEPSEMSEDLILEEPQDISRLTTASPYVEANVEPAGAPSNPPADTAVSNPPAPQEACKAAEDLIATQPQDSCASPTLSPCAETSNVLGTGHMDGKPSNKPAESAASDPPSSENGASKAGVSKPIEPAVEEERIGSSRWIETAEDEKFVQQLKDQLDCDW